MSKFNKRVGAFSVSPYSKHAVTKYRKGHYITVIPNESTPGKIIKINGHRVLSHRQALSLIRKHVHKYHYHKHFKHHKNHRRNHYPHHMYRYLAYNHNSFGGADDMTGRVHYARVQVIKIHNLVRHPHSPDDQVYTCRTDNRGFKKTFRRVNKGFHIRYQKIHGHVYVLDDENGGTLVK